MKKLSISLLLILIMILSISVVCAADTDGLTDLTVAQNETDDIGAVDEEAEPIEADNEQDVVDSTGPTKSFTDLRNDIDGAGSELKLDSDYKYNETVDTAAENAVRYVDGVFINKNMTIDGAGHTIDGSEVNRVFKVYGFTAVTLKNIIFINGQADVGSAVYSAGSLTYENCTFIKGSNVYNDTTAVSSGSVYENPATSRYTVITDEASYNAALADPTSPLNRYYYAFNREDSIKADGTPAGAGDFVVGHSWEAAIKAPTTPARTATLPWIVINLVGISGELVVEYDGEVKLTDYIAGPYSVMMYSVPNELGMEDYRLEWGTGNAGTETLVASEVGLEYTPYKSFTDLRNAIDDTPAEGTLVLEDNYGYNPVDDIAAKNAIRYVDGIFINKNLTIDANGHVIDASTVNRAFIVYGFTAVTIKNAVFINGKGDKGKAIYSAGNLTFENCTFIKGSDVYDDASAVSSGSVYENTATSRFTVIKDEASYNATLADPASPLNRYYYAFNREDGIDADGNPVYDSTTIIVGHSWEAAIKAPTTPSKTATLPWIAINLVGIINEDLVVEYEGKAVKVEHIEGPFSVMLYSVPNELTDMEDYRLEWGTGNPGTKTIDDSEVEVLDIEKAGTYTDLQAQIDAAIAAGADLVLPYDFTYDSEYDGANFAEGVLINSALTINGNGFTICGNNSARIFKISANDVNLTNITFVNGSASEGGAIRYSASNGKLNIANSTFISNNATSGKGGAIYVYYGVPTIEGSQFYNNTAKMNGGAICLWRAEGTINGSYFENNNATLSPGGAINLAVGGRVTYTEFVDNHAFMTNAAAIAANGKVYVGNCNFTGANSIDIVINSIVTLENNNELGAKVVDAYSVRNSGTLTLINNKFNTTIINKGTIANTIVNATLLDNQTINKNLNDVAILNATLTDGNGNAIYDARFKITAKGTVIDTIDYDDATNLYTSEYTLNEVDQNIISTDYEMATEVNIGIINVARIETVLTVNVENIEYGQNATVEVTLKDINGNDLNGTVTVTINNIPYPIAVIGGSGSINNVSGLAAKDNYLANATIEEFGNYTEANATDLFNVSMASSGVEISNVVNATYPGDVTIGYGIENGTFSKVVVIKDDVEITDGIDVSVANTVVISGLSAGVYNITVFTNGDENHTGSSDSALFNVSQAVPVISVSAVGATYPGNVTVTVSANVGGDYVVKVGGKEIPVTLVAGEAKEVNVTGLTANETGYIINVTYTSDNENYTDAFNDTETVKLMKATITITLDTEGILVCGNDYNVTFVLPEDVDGKINATLNDTYQQSYGKYGNKYVIPEFASNAGDFKFAVNLTDDTNYNDAYGSLVVHISKYDTPVDINVTKPLDGENATLNVTVPEDAGGNVTVTLSNGTNYTAPVDENGTAIISVPNLPVGDNEVNVTYTSGNPDYTSKTIPTTIHVNKFVINANSMTRGYNSGMDYQAKLTDEDGNPIANRTLTFTIKGKQYNATTDASGIAKINPLLAVGKYGVIISFPKADNATAVVNIVKRTTGQNLVMDYLDGSKYKVRVIGDDGKPVGKGVVVQMTVNGVTYKVKTNKNGYAYLPIKLKPKTYTITSKYKADTLKKKITVKQTLKVKKTVKVKKYAKKLVLTATLKWSNGKAIKSKKVVFKFKGKFYKAKTNKKGVAKVTIKQKVINKLKKGKKYTYYAKYVNEFAYGKVLVK